MNPDLEPLTERLRSAIARSIPHVTPELADAYSTWLVTGTVTSAGYLRRFYRDDIHEESSYLLLLYTEDRRYPSDHDKFTKRLEALELLLSWKDAKPDHTPTTA